MKKLFEKLLGQNLSQPTPLKNNQVRTDLKVVPPGKKNEFLGTQQGYVAVIVFPEYPELAAILNDEASAGFLRDYSNVIQKVLGKKLSLIDMSKDGVATIAVADNPKQSPQAVTEMFTELDKFMLIWVGTFGRMSIPPLKYKLGIGRGEMTISESEPKIIGPAVDQALEIAQKVCVEFDVRVAASGDLIRASSEAASWVDLDDWMFTGAGPKTAAKPVRVFSRLTDRLDPEDLQILRAGRKAYFHQNWEEAAQKFDRINRVPGIRGITEKYIKRIKSLKKRPKNPEWDGVYRKEGE